MLYVKRVFAELVTSRMPWWNYRHQPSREMWSWKIRGFDRKFSFRICYRLEQGNFRKRMCLQIITQGMLHFWTRVTNL